MTETMEQSMEVQELSLEKAIEIKLVQNNVTEQVLAELKSKYGGLKLKALDDKESYLELKSAAKDCAKIRNLTTTVCKAGREEAVKTQKKWVAEEKRVISVILEVEKPLDDEIARFDAEVERKVAEENERQEEAYINRQSVLTKMGAVYSDKTFVLGDASFDAELVKFSSEEVWEEAIVPKFKEEYEKIEAERIEEQKKKDEEAAEMKRQQEELRKQQEELRAAQEEMQRQKDLAEKEARNKEQKELVEKERIKNELQISRFNKMFPYNKYGTDNMSNLWTLAESDFEEKLAEKKKEFEKIQGEESNAAEAKRLKEIEDAKALAIQQEKQRIANEEAERQAALESAKDKEKWESFINDVKKLEVLDMRSGQYRRKMQVAREKIEEILSL